MAKDFKSRIGSKRLNTLIPDAEPSPTLVSEPVAKAKPSLKKQIYREPIEKMPPTPSQTVVSTFRINNEKLKTIKAIAFWDRKKIQDVFDEALGQYIESMPKATVKKALEEYTKRTE